MTGKLKKDLKRSHGVDDFKEGVKRDAEELVLKKFPKKISEVDQLLKDNRFSLQSCDVKTELNVPLLQDIETFNSTPLKKKSRNSDQIQKENRLEDQIKDPVILGLITRNKYLEEKVSIIRPLIHELTDDVLSLKIGISLMIPKIEDGNNFGVSIQRETLETIGSIEEDMHSRLNAISAYYSARADLVAKMVKNPSIQDYRNAIEERDQLFNTFLCVSLTLVRNYYTNLHDLVLKNMNKIKKPKTTLNEEMIF